MEDNKKKRCCCSRKAKEVNNVHDFPGAAVDVADDENVSAKAVKAETKEMNNNPRADAE